MSDEMQELLDRYGDLVVWDDCDEAIVGVAERCSQPPLVVYDYDMLVNVFLSQGMTYEDARDWISFNIAGAWIGDQTPLILHRPPE